MARDGNGQSGPAKRFNGPLNMKVKHYAITIIRNFDFDNPDKTACGRGDKKSATKIKADVTCTACKRWIEKSDRYNVARN